MIAELPHGYSLATPHRWLQWGRDQLIAELASVVYEFNEFTALQWGRDQLIAELGFRTLAFGARTPASMGPRSIDRGT